jgi:hypothetical protein
MLFNIFKPIKEKSDTENDIFQYLLTNDNDVNCLLTISKDLVNLTFENIQVDSEDWQDCSIIQEELEKYCLNNLDTDSKMILINGFSN